MVAGFAALASWPETRRGRVVALLLALALGNLLLLAPRWIVPAVLPAHAVAVEPLLLVLLFAALPRRWWSIGLAALAAAALLAVSGALVADAALRLSLSRPLNLTLDARLLGSVDDLLRGAFGPARALLLEGGALLAALGGVAVLGHLLAPRPDGAPLLRGRLAIGAALVLALAGVAAARHPAPVVGAPAVRLVEEQARARAQLAVERARFREDLRARPGGYADLPGLLQGLGGSDLVLAFVESYGTSVVDDPRYAPVVRPRLEDMERRIRAAGLHLATGRLVAPSQGGQSWLGHGSVLSGLWLDNQMRYDLTLASDRPTLIQDFEAAGYRTAALMPAITLAWPEGAQLGYEEIFTFHDIDYAGPPLNWVTMPDQFTWSFLQRRILERPGDERPVFAEIGLISSHAPWTPILPVLEDWNDIGDGSVFARWEGAGERPEELWLDPDRVREHYARSIEYAVHAAASWAERFVDEDVLLVVLGDHQPAPLVTGDGAPRTVPVHVISGSADLVRPFVEWGFRPGAFWDPAIEAPGMDRFRDWFVKTFSRE